ncbi:MAG: Fic family protein [Akkermansiaceae bacterium]
MENPPFTITPTILDLLAQTQRQSGTLASVTAPPTPPKLRRENRIKSVHASLAIENNSLSLNQVTTLFNGKRVLGPLKEVQEVKNAFTAYEALENFNPTSVAHLLQAHSLMMDGLVDHPGTFRTGRVGIAKGETIVHVAPPASLVPGLVNDLLTWLKQTDIHPLIASCIFHYELEFIHPFTDGNGRIGRLWQTLILSHWKAPLAYLPVEDIIR